ncbi:MAG: septum formation inhibitor Maf [Campylobacterota bacterium]|nr:septum formation inhibitor Maf [Campylobacterota bacterium]
MIRLGSNSITRAEILKAHDIEFIQSGSDFDEEQITTKDPKEFVYEATMGKYKDCLKLYGLDIPLLVADTVVTAQGELLRKPKDEDDARRILNLQSGSRTSIITCMVFATKDEEFVDISATHYDFGKFEEDDLENYLKSGQWRGKAGGCMVEGFCKKYIKQVEGLESCAMGLTIEKILDKIPKNNIQVN